MLQRGDLQLGPLAGDIDLLQLAKGIVVIHQTDDTGVFLGSLLQYGMRRDTDIGKLDGVLAGEAFEVDLCEVFHRQWRLIEPHGEIQVVELVLRPYAVLGNGLLFDVGTGLGIAPEHREVPASGQRGIRCRGGSGCCGRMTRWKGGNS